MNKTLKNIFQEIDITPNDLTINQLENTNHFKFIHNKFAEREGKLTFKRIFVLKLIAVELVSYENFSAVDFNSYKDELKKHLFTLGEEAISDLLSSYFGGSLARKHQIIENIEYLTSNNEKINLGFLINILANTIVDEINYEILAVKTKLQAMVNEEEWYTLYCIDSGEYSKDKYKNEKDRINTILEAAL